MAAQTQMRDWLRGLSTVLIVTGLLLLVDAGLTVLWQEPVSAVYALIVQDRLDGDLHKLEIAPPDALEREALAALQGEQRKMAFLARRLKRTAGRGAAIGRITIPKINADYVIVNGTDTASLRKGPGVYDDTPLPGAPGTVGIAGHRTTYLAPFRDIDRLRPGDRISVRMPYGLFTYAVQKTQIVPPTDVGVVRRVPYDRLVLSACHPKYSAAKRIVVFSKLVSARALGAALAHF